ncbi:MAG: CDP-glycerol glycerophosphotransferase family protein [Oscillospiraceae bacterium]|nr:CDP-glycerol glycerophosphotransferase family protein [Oscillospiraceae bacterium]
MGKIKKLYDKCKSVYGNFRNPWWRAKKKYIKLYEQCEIDDHTILLEASHGAVTNGNIFYLLRYLSQSERYRDYKIYLSAMGRRAKGFKKLLEAYGIDNVNITIQASEEYFRLLNSAKYLINDTTFSPYFTKKEGQVYLNTWHGTPLKALGKGVKSEPHVLANVQKNMVWADYMLFPNAHTRDALIKDYMLENISKGSYIMSGYPRNEAFFDAGRRSSLRADLELEDKKVYAYMPTYRGAAQKGWTPKNTYYLNYYLYELDKRLGDDEIMYVNLHPLAKKDVEFKQFQHIRNFPGGYETYDFLNAADVLITDYSSVFFDYACSGRKIVLFTYDEEEYLNDRGMYMSMDELPFPRVADVEPLLRELRSEKNYDDGPFLDRFCPYDSGTASQKLCDFVILGQDTGLKVERMPDNGKENVLMYAGNLSGNGITAALRSLLGAVDLEKRNYYFCFFSEFVSKYKDTVLSFPEGAKFYAFTGEPNLTFCDLVIRRMFRKKWIKADTYMKLQGKRVKQGLDRNIGGAKFDQVIHYNGYEQDQILMLSTFDGPRTIYVHSNMVNEIKTKGNQRADVLHYAYNTYDHVAVVTEDMIEPTLELSGKRENIVVAKNLINYQTILDKAQAEIALDPVTRSNVTVERLKEILASDSECFINVGRFAPEKGHERLVSAFSRYLKSHPDAYLIIMGGYSLYGGYDKLLQLSEELGIPDRLILLEKVSNPYPIVKACDYFVLSSFYEGFGLVLAEADILGVPVVSTDIAGPRGFMKKNGGMLVEDSEDGVLKGMEMLHAGQIGPMNVDYEQYNQDAIQEFENILTGAC